MQSRYATNWSYKWSRFGTDIQNFTAMFSCPQVGTNILYKYSEIKELVENNVQSMIPRQVLLDSLFECQQQQKAAMKEVA